MRCGWMCALRFSLFHCACFTSFILCCCVCVRGGSGSCTYGGSTGVGGGGGAGQVWVLQVNVLTSVWMEAGWQADVVWR